MFVKYTSEKGFSGQLTDNGYKIFNPMGKNDYFFTASCKL